MKIFLLIFGKSFYAQASTTKISALTQAFSLDQDILNQLDALMIRKLYEKNNIYKSQRIIDLKHATKYDPINYFNELNYRE